MAAHVGVSGSLEGETIAETIKMAAKLNLPQVAMPPLLPPSLPTSSSAPSLPLSYLPPPLLSSPPFFLSPGDGEALLSPAYS